MFEWLSDALMAVVGGGATGILGSAVQSLFQYKTKGLEIQQEKYRLDHDANMVKSVSYTHLTLPTIYSV